MRPRRPVRRAVARVVRAARPKRRVRLDIDQRRTQLLALAKAAFSDRSYDEVSIDDLAREAKISKGLLYHYFPTKRDLYVAGLREIAGELVAAITSVPNDLAPIDRIRAGLDAYLTHIERHARAYVSLMRGGIGSDPEVNAVVEGVRSELFDQFIESSPLGAPLGDNAKFATTVRGWIGFVESATIDWCTNRQMSRDELRELLAQILVVIMSSIVPELLRAT